VSFWKFWRPKPVLPPEQPPQTPTTPSKGLSEAEQGKPTPETPDDALAAILNPNAKAEPIEFRLPTDDPEAPETILIPCPLPVRTWFWALQNCFEAIDPNEHAADERFTNALIDGLLMKMDELISVATGIRLERLKHVDPAEMEAVQDRLAIQLKGEMVEASPFSTTNLKQAVAKWNRKIRMAVAYLPGSDGGAKPSESSPKSAEDTGKK